MVDLRALEFDSDGEEVHYGEDDNPLPNDPLLPPTQPRIDTSLSPDDNDLISSAPPSCAASVTNSNGVAN